MLYTQSWNPQSQDPDTYNEDIFAKRNANFHAGEGFEQGSDGEDVVPWFRSNCRALDDCQTFPFSVTRLYIYRPDDDEEEEEKERDTGLCACCRVWGREYVTAVDGGCTGGPCGCVCLAFATDLLRSHTV